MRKNVLFWNVDTQFDFIEPEGRLYVKDAEHLKPVLSKITSFAKKYSVRVVNTCDYHLINSEELSSSPDYQHSFPLHCMAGTHGAEFIAETNPELPVIIDWKGDLAILPGLDDAERFRNIIIRKDAFDVFEGNPHAEKLLAILHPDLVVVYGVTTNVCVDRAVCGLAERGYPVWVAGDAIKELPGLPLPFEQWEKLGVKMMNFSEIKKQLETEFKSAQG